MGLKKFLMKLLRQPSKPEALQSDATKDLQRSFERSEALQIAQDIEEKQEIQDIKEETPLEPLEESPKLSPPVELQKDSLQLGIAAGYTGKFIKDVDSSLGRIESQMITKDWFISQFKDSMQELIEVIKNHDSNVLKRFESIESALTRMQSIAEIVPEPVKGELLEEIKTIKKQLPLSSKMEQLISVVKEAGQISYDDLGSKLGISRSSLRGLLANTMKRTLEIERYKVNGKGWVKYKAIESI